MLSIQEHLIDNHVRHTGLEPRPSRQGPRQARYSTAATLRSSHDWACPRLGQMRADNILELFDEIDTSGDGTIDYKEFKVWP